MALVSTRRVSPVSAPARIYSTLAAVTGRDVVVPPNPGAMGAWGIGLCALEQLKDAVEVMNFDLEITPFCAI